MLTPRQETVLKYIENHIREHGFPPAVREIGEAIGAKSPNGVLCHLRALQRKGRISITGKSRGIRLIGGCCPMCGASLERTNEPH